MMLVGAAVKPKAKKGEIQIDDVSAQLSELKEDFLQNTLIKKELKAHDKERKALDKKSDKEGPKPRLYVVDFIISIIKYIFFGILKSVNFIRYNFLRIYKNINFKRHKSNLVLAISSVVFFIKYIFSRIYKRTKSY